MDERTILADQDGVLIDFIGTAAKWCGVNKTAADVTTWNFFTDWGFKDATEFWSVCKGREFWESMEPYPYAAEFLDKLKQMFPVYIATAPSDDDDCMAGKMACLRKHFGLSIKDVSFTVEKRLLAHPLHVLIDDGPHNITGFLGNGGLAFGFAQPWNKFTHTWQDILDLLAPLSIR